MQPRELTLVQKDERDVIMIKNITFVKPFFFFLQKDLLRHKPSGCLNSAACWKYMYATFRKEVKLNHMRKAPVIDISSKPLSGFDESSNSNTVFCNSEE